MNSLNHKIFSMQMKIKAQLSNDRENTTHWRTWRIWPPFLGPLIWKPVLHGDITITFIQTITTEIVQNRVKSTCWRKTYVNSNIPEKWFVFSHDFYVNRNQPTAWWMLTVPTCKNLRAALLVWFTIQGKGVNSWRWKRLNFERFSHWATITYHYNTERSAC